MKINFFDNQSRPIIEVVQGDTARSLVFEPSDYDIPSGSTATYYVARPSHIPVYNEATIDYTNNSVTVNLTAESIAEVGENYLQVRILQGNDILTSFSVILMVRRFGGAGAVESRSEIGIFDQIIRDAREQLQDVIDDTLTQENVAADAKATGDAIEAVRLNFTDPNNDGNIVITFGGST